MKTFKPKNTKEIINLISYLNFCHDGSLRKICFLKNREVDITNGSLIYPFENTKEFIDCDIEVELILNSYEGAKKDQIILFEFKNTKSFGFSQNEGFDYSDIYEVEFKSDNNANLNFIFYTHKPPNAPNEKIAFLSIVCKEIICIEK
jgi:hypothetical protein